MSGRPSAEISEEERRYENGVSPKVLDIIEIPVLGPAPQTYQTENHVVDAQSYWSRKGEIGWPAVRQLVDPCQPLWVNGDSTYYGLNGRVKIDVASKLSSSLALIAPDVVTLKVVTEGAEFGNPRRRVRAAFEHAQTHYSLAVTDPVAERALLAKPDGEYRPKDTYLCVSLGEPHSDGWCYKLVATVIGRQPL